MTVLYHCYIVISQRTVNLYRCRKCTHSCCNQYINGIGDTFHHKNGPSGLHTNSYFVIRANVLKTRMHSSSMRTVRCSGRLGWWCLPRGCLSRGCLPRGGGVWLGSVCRGGCLPGVYTSPCEQNDRRVQ